MPTRLSNAGGCEIVIAEGLKLLNENRTFVELQAFSHEGVDAAWEELPREWRDVLLGASAPQLAQLCVGEVPAGAPPSLCEFVRATQAAQLDAQRTEGAHLVAATTSTSAAAAGLSRG